MSIKLGTTNIGAVYKGSTPIAAIYKGSTLVYSSTPEPICFTARSVGYFRAICTIGSTLNWPSFEYKVDNYNDPGTWQTFQTSSSNKLLEIQCSYNDLYPERATKISFRNYTGSSGYINLGYDSPSYSNRATFNISGDISSWSSEPSATIELFMTHTENIGTDSYGTIIDASRLKIKGVRNYTRMFKNQSRLQYLPDFSGIQLTSSTYGFNNMFENCIGLTDAVFNYTGTLFSGTCAYMFQSCKSLESIRLDFTAFDASNTGIGRNMFDLCNALTSITFTNYTGDISTNHFNARNSSSRWLSSSLSTTGTIYYNGSTTTSEAITANIIPNTWSIASYVES